jgi:hypothetical protein
MKRVFLTLWFLAAALEALGQHDLHGHDHDHDHDEHDPARETPGALFEELGRALEAQPGQRMLYKFTGVAPRVGMAVQRGLFAEAGLGLDIQRIGYTAASEFPSFGYSNLRPYLAGEIMAGRHLLGGGKAGIEYIRSTPLLGMAFGGYATYLTDGMGRAVLITPRLMFSFVRVEIYYGYNFFVRNELTRWVGHHRFGVSMTVNPRFWSRKQQIYEHYYDSYL